MKNITKIKNWTHSLCCQKGMSLVSMSLFIVALGLVLTSFLTVSRQVDQRMKMDETINRTEIIQDALQSFIAQNNRLPCPASMTAGIDQATDGATNTAGFGVEVHTALGMPNCDIDIDLDPFDGNGLGPVGVITSNAGARVQVGALPVRALNLPDDFIADGFGKRMRYAVTSSFTDAATADFTNGIGAISISDTGGNPTGSAAGGLIYALVAPGQMDQGEYSLDGNLIQPVDPANTENVDFNASFVQTLEKNFDLLSANANTQNFAFLGPNKTFTWAYSPWNCDNTIGEESRTAQCEDETGALAAPDTLCGTQAPLTQVVSSCPIYTYNWVPDGTFGTCNGICNAGIEVINHKCQRSAEDPITGAITLTDEADTTLCTGAAPTPTQPCDLANCIWNDDPFGACDNTCGTGTQTRANDCFNFHLSGIEGNTSLCDVNGSQPQPLSQSCSDASGCNPTCGSADGADYGHISLIDAGNLCAQGTAENLSGPTAGNKFAWQCREFVATVFCEANYVPLPAPVCGSANGVPTEGAPSGGALCSNGAATAVSFTGTSYDWTCAEIGHPQQVVNCSAPNVAPVCGADHGQTHAGSPVNLCSEGTASTVSLDSSVAPNKYNWSCAKVDHTAVNCSSNLASIDASCGSATQTCDAGTYEAFQHPSSTVDRWRCRGISGGANQICKIVECGNADGGTFTSTPPAAQRCGDSQTPSVTETATSYNWTCLGQGTGSVRNCSATKAPICSFSTNEILLEGATGQGQCNALANKYTVCASADPSTENACETRFESGQTGAPGRTQNNVFCNVYGFVSSCGSHSTPSQTNGSCGSADGGSFTSAPSAGLCSSGSATAVSNVTGGYQWDCLGSNGGTHDSCSATESTPDLGCPDNSLGVPELCIAPGTIGVCSVGTDICNLNSCCVPPGITGAGSCPGFGQHGHVIVDPVSGTGIGIGGGTCTVRQCNNGTVEIVATINQGSQFQGITCGDSSGVGGI